MPRSKILIIILFLLLIVFAVDGGRKSPAAKYLTLGGQKISLEIAATEAEQTRGLSGRASLPDNQGLLFVYTQDVQPAFWMKEMNFPLDIIWLDKNLTVIGWVSNLSPATYPRTFSPPAPIRYGLEVKAGFVDKYHLKAGDRAYN